MQMTDPCLWFLWGDLPENGASLSSTFTAPNPANGEMSYAVSPDPGHSEQPKKCIWLQKFAQYPQLFAHTDASLRSQEWEWPLIEVFMKFSVILGPQLLLSQCEHWRTGHDLQNTNTSGSVSMEACFLSWADNAMHLLLQLLVSFTVKNLAIC